MLEEDLKDYPAILSVKDLTKILDLSEPMVRRIVHSHGFPKIDKSYSGRRILVPKQGFINWLEKQCQI